MTMFTFPINDQGFISSIVKQPNPTKSDLQKCSTILAATPQDYYAKYESAIKLKIKAISKTPSPIEKTMTAYQLYQAQNPLWTINVKTTTVYEIIKISFINISDGLQFHTLNMMLTENRFLELIATKKIERTSMENHTNKTYQERMNKTASSKFGAIEKHLEKGIKLLDFGSGFSPEFIEQVQQTGAHYIAYDVSQIVQNQLKENNIDFLTKEQLQNTEDEFDVIYLSSVFHELMSYLSRPERRETFAMLDKALKPDGVIIIRDWGYDPNPDYITSFEVASSDAHDEIHTWIKELVKNAILTKPTVIKQINRDTEPDFYIAARHDIYEITDDNEEQIIGTRKDKMNALANYLRRVANDIEEKD